ncbi:hypothetical protein [Aliivibrio sp. EL58]|uniref:hypothetical protein n=1 Tax=Aliivibrio sp. EL58 TaxID=2107582 RepID=UPI000EFCEA64|nr:hypothetical protein [Aliivibrio sp. EL58]
MHVISSLTSRVLFNLTLALLPATIIIALNIWYEYRTEKQLVQDEVRSTVNALASEHIETIGEIELMLKELSYFSELQDPSSKAYNKLISDSLKLNANLINIGVLMANGDLFSKPLPVKEFEKFIQTHAESKVEVEFEPRFM